MELVDACRDGKLDQVVELLKRVDPSRRDNAAIRWASFHGHVEMVKLLLKQERVDPGAKDNDAIQWASIGGHVEVVRLLLQDKRVRRNELPPDTLEHLNEYYKEVYAMIQILQKKVHPDLTKQIVLFVYDL
jgi:ankyrin repeat protein